MNVAVDHDRIGVDPVTGHLGGHEVAFEIHHARVELALEVGERPRPPCSPS
jgi:hypothetical protein